MAKKEEIINLELTSSSNTNSKENDKIFLDTQQLIYSSAVKEKLLEEKTNLITVSKIMFELMYFADELRNDYYDYHTEKQKELSFPIMRSCFCYCYGKGAEYAYFWDKSDENITEDNEPVYSIEDAVNDVNSFNVDEDYLKFIELGKMACLNVFCDFQNEIIIKLCKDPDRNKNILSEYIYSAFFFIALIGFNNGVKLLLKESKNRKQ